jgi:hypothetical protein
MTFANDMTCYGDDIKALADLAGDFELRSPMDVTTWYRRDWQAIADVLGFAQQLAAMPTAVPTNTNRIAAMNTTGLAAFERALQGRRAAASDEQARVQSGANASGIYRPTAPNGKYVPLVTPGTFKDGLLATSKSRSPCWFADGVKGGKHYGYETAQQWPYDEKTGEFRAPPPSTLGSRSGNACVPWPPVELLLSQYKRADEVMTTPAAQAVAQLQRRRLSRSLDCAYVRPLAVDGRPAYAAFVDNTSLRDHCIDMRKRLLKHPARMGVEYETVREVDKEYAEALRESGIPTTAIQRSAMKFGIKLGAATSEPLDPMAPAPENPRPLMGGLPFDPGGGGDEEKSRSWLGPALLGGAALATTIGIAIGVSRRTRAAARM